MEKNKITIAEVVKALEGELISGEDKLDRAVESFGATDLLSDVLAMGKTNYALLTGLTNVQILRTAEITNACCVVIVRNKQPQPAAVSLAKRNGIPLILSRLTMFDACCTIGRLLEGSDARTEGTSNTAST
ncbi:MAG: DRTGG domain-containing protein [Victivallales bacterium]